jgi:hypothetical protein
LEKPFQRDLQKEWTASQGEVAARKELSFPKKPALALPSLN